jgi:hypothetical protein
MGENVARSPREEERQIKKEGPYMKLYMIALLILPVGCGPSSFGQTTATQDADALEAQYKTCAKHSIPSDKCTPEIYRQLQEKDSAAAKLDPQTAEALTAVAAYRDMLKNPDSMQVRSAKIVDFTIRKDAYHAICLVIGGQNGFGGVTERGVAYVTYGHGEKTKSLWTENASGFGRTYESMCFTPHAFSGPVPRDGIDVTEKVNQALKRSKQ